MPGFGSPLERYAWVEGLRERNLTLFHRLLADHIEGMMLIVYTPTMGTAPTAQAKAVPQ